MKVLFTGDSITDCGRNRGNIGSFGESYALMIAGELLYRMPEKGLVFMNQGCSGDKIVDLLARWKRDCLNHAPDVISILVGVNDVWHELGNRDGVSAEMFEKIYDIVLAETKTRLPNAKIILCEPFVLKASATESAFARFESEVKLRAGAVKRLADKHKCVFVPLQEAFNKACEKAPASYWLSDGVHPSPAGNMLMTREWIRTTEGII
jgi:lysophospholipase L1-like esterase